MRRTIILLMAMTILVLCTCLAAHAVVNLATLATPTAETTYNSSTGPEKAIDGVRYTEWSSADADSWYQLTWSSPQTIRQVVLKYELWINGGADSRDMALQRLDSDGVTWVDIAAHTMTPARDKFAPAGVMPGTGDPYAEYGFHVFDFEAVTTTAIRLTHQHAIWDLEVREFPNLAVSAIATAQSSYGDGGYYPEKAMDDAGDTEWSSTDSGDGALDSWFQLTWSSPQTINNVVLKYEFWTGEPSRDVALQRLDADGVTWVDIASYTMLPARDTWNPATGYGYHEFNFDAVTTTAIRMTHQHAMWELEAYDLSSLVTITGTITTANAPYVVCGATISYGLWSTTSQADGTYSLSIPAGSTVQVTADSYDNAQKTIATGGVCDFTLIRTAGNLVVQAYSLTSSPEANEPASAAADGNPCSSWSSASLTPDYDDAWLEVDWSSAVTADTVKIKTGSAKAVYVDVWADGSWMQVASVAGDISERAALTFPLTLEFNPVVTERLRLRKIGRVAELEVYNLKGAAQAANVTGIVTNSLNGAPVVGARVTIGAASCLTSEAGGYLMAAAPGNSTIEVSRLGYDGKSESVQVPSSGSVTKNIVLPTKNIAPQSTITAIRSGEGYDPSWAIDDRLDTKFFSNTYAAGSWYELEWPTAKWLDRVIVRKTWMAGSSNVSVSYWDGAAWHELKRVVAGLNATVEEISMSFYPVSTTKIRLEGPTGFFEIEAYQTTAPNPVPTNIGDLGGLPDGSFVQITGSTTAAYTIYSAFYVESLDRSAGVRVEPLSVIQPVDTGNLALTGTADASSVYETNPQYGPDKANDGNVMTEWSCYPQGGDPNASWWLDWATPQVFNKVVFMYELVLDNPRTVTLQVKDEFGNYVDAGTVETTYARDYVDPNSGYGIRTFNLPSAVTSTGIRLSNLQCLWEVEVYNDAGGIDTLLDREATVNGVLTTINGKRMIMAGPSQLGEASAVRPLAMGARSLAIGGQKPYTDGLLVTVWGKVLSNSDSYLLIEDGSGLPVRVGPTSSSAAPGDYVIATGVAWSTTVDNAEVRAVMPRRDSDVR